MPLDRFVEIARALADPSRVRMLHACRDRELCVCQITELLGLAPSTVSRHLSILRRAGLLVSRKKGRWIHCRLPGDEAPAVVRDALDLLQDALGRDPTLAEDRRRRRAILAIDPDVLCRRQRDGDAAGARAAGARGGAR